MPALPAERLCPNVAWPDLETSLAWGGRNRTASRIVSANAVQTATKTEGQQTPGRLLGVKANERYGFSALFYKSSELIIAGLEDDAAYVLIRNDKTGQTSKPIKLDDNFESLQDVWSPMTTRQARRCKSSTSRDDASLRLS
jgi:hypothetical protein